MTSNGTEKGKGRQKVKMEKMEKQSNLQVTFSKRRNGLFKKAFELSFLTEAEVVAVVYSPGGKAYSFGHPSVEIVADKLQMGNSQPQQVQSNAKAAKMMEELEAINKQVELEKKRGEELDRILEQKRTQLWGDGKDLSKIKQSYEEMKVFKACVEKMKKLRATQGIGGGSGNGGGGNES